MMVRKSHQPSMEDTVNEPNPEAEARFNESGSQVQANDPNYAEATPATDGSLVDADENDADDGE